MLATVSLLLLSWAYARAEAQILATTEYTGFLWAMLFGWYVYAEPVTLPTPAGALLIVVACLIVARKTPRGDPIEQAAAYRSEEHTADSSPKCAYRRPSSTGKQQHNSQATREA